jgi:hypothetical protein
MPADHAGFAARPAHHALFEPLPQIGSLAVGITHPTDWDAASGGSANMMYADHDMGLASD